MGGFLGIGTSSQEKALEDQKRLKQEEAEKARREAELRLAEKKAKKGQETATVKLGTTDMKSDAPVKKDKKARNDSSLTQISSNLGLGGGTGTQL